MPDNISTTSNAAFHVYYARNGKEFNVAVMEKAVDGLPKKAKHIEIAANGRGWADLPIKVQRGIIGMDRLPDIAEGNDHESGHGQVKFVPDALEIIAKKTREPKARKTIDQKIGDMADFALAKAEDPDYKPESKQGKAFALFRNNMTTKDWAVQIGEHVEKMNGFLFVRHCLLNGYVRRKGS